MFEENVFESSNNNTGYLGLEDAPTGVVQSNHPDTLIYDTGSRPNGSEYRLEIEDNGIYSLEVRNSPWNMLDDQDKITGNVKMIRSYQDLSDNLRQISFNRNTERLDNFIDFLIDRELR